MHGVRVILVRDWAVLTRARVPRRDYAFPHDASIVRGEAVVVHVVSSKAPSTDFPQRAVVLIVVGRVLIAFETIREGSGRPGPFTLLTRKETKVSFRNCLTFKTVAAVFIDPF
jgi:hypothetical protein